MLFLRTENPNSGKIHTPWLIDTAGKLATTFDFTGKKVLASCGVTFQNEHFIFGGEEKKRTLKF